jgi:hypothetical protein
MKSSSKSALRSGIMALSGVGVVVTGRRVVVLLLSAPVVRATVVEGPIEADVGDMLPTLVLNGELVGELMEAEGVEFVVVGLLVVGTANGNAVRAAQ